MNNLIKTILWLLAGAIIITSFKTFFNITGITSFLTSIVLWFLFYKIYIKLIPSNWK